MTALILTPENYRLLKRALRPAFPHIGSAHLSEALAAGLRHKTHAALLEHLRQFDPEMPEFILLDDGAFLDRLEALDHDLHTDDREFGIFDALGIPEDGKILVKTTPPSAYDISYKSMRARAWRNVMIAAINAGLERKLFSLRPGDNRWHAAPDERGVVFDFTFGDGVPALAYVGDGGFDELSVHVALWPTPQGRRFVRAVRAYFEAGEVYATGWVERRRGAWLQSSTREFSCRKNRLALVAGAAVEPRGYGDRGAIIL